MAAHGTGAVVWSCSVMFDYVTDTMRLHLRPSIISPACCSQGPQRRAMNNLLYSQKYKKQQTNGMNERERVTSAKAV
jgi:hypothetical protein